MSKDQYWSCVKDCGACCRLAPSEREEAIRALGPKEKKLYFSLVAKDGWCRFYDKSRRICTIYHTRPEFCKVKNLTSIFNLPKGNFDQFAIECCKQQIRHIYGGRSKEMKRFRINLKKRF